jgi:hypothetical protein
MEWCRLYGEMLNDPKVGTLSDAQFRTWMELLMVATTAEADGNTKLTQQSIDWALRRNASVTLHELLQRELVVLNESGEVVINAWSDRQKKSDSSAGRVAKFREKQRLMEGNGDVTLQKRDGNGLEKNREEKNREEVKPKTQHASRFDAQAHLESAGVDPKVARDWLDLRKGKRLKPTETALAGVQAEAIKAEMTMDAVIRLCCTRGWGGFDASWLTGKGNVQASGGNRKFDPVAYVNKDRVTDHERPDDYIDV